MPKPKIVWEVDDKNKSIQNIVTEWEKNKIKIVAKRVVYVKLNKINFKHVKNKINKEKELNHRCQRA